MRFLRQLVAVAALAAVGAGGISSLQAAAHDPQAAVIGRQQIRAELAAAMAKGHLTRMDQYHLLLHAKEILTHDDFEGFERTLDRLATRPGVMHVETVRSGDYAPAEPPTDIPMVEAGVAPSNYEVSAGQPKAADAGTEVIPAPGASPFMEESPQGIGRPTMQQQIEEGDEDGCCEDCDPCRMRRRWFSLEVFSAIEGFKGPIDVGNANGNFGVRVGGNAAVSIFQRMGIALQAGIATDITNLEGSPYPAPNSVLRDQIFTTVGLFQRINRPDGAAFTWGFAYDFLFDDYYTDFRFGQWRVKAEYEANPWDAIGVQASIPEHGATGALPTFIGTVDLFPFKPITQGNVYWTHTFCNQASLTGRFGVAERPSNFVFGGDSCVPLTQNMALTSSFTYIMPNTGAGPVGQTEETWNVSVGVEWVPGGFGHCGSSRFAPFIPVADNGSFAFRQTQ